MMSLLDFMVSHRAELLTRLGEHLLLVLLSIPATSLLGRMVVSRP